MKYFWWKLLCYIQISSLETKAKYCINLQNTRMTVFIVCGYVESLETGSHCGSLGWPETMWTKMILKSERASCFCLLNAGIQWRQELPYPSFFFFSLKFLRHGKRPWGSIWGSHTLTKALHPVRYSPVPNFHVLKINVYSILLSICWKYIAVVDSKDTMNNAAHVLIQRNSKRLLSKLPINLALE